ncbi:MAG: hypothetical protein ACI9N0_003467 [Ilumatobacter sp.]
MAALIGRPVRADIEWSIVAEPGVTALALCASPPAPPPLALPVRAWVSRGHWTDDLSWYLRGVSSLEVRGVQSGKSDAASSSRAVEKERTAMSCKSSRPRSLAGSA